METAEWFDVDRDITKRAIVTLLSLPFLLYLEDLPYFFVYNFGWAALSSRCL
jgi:hypothetical protein